MKKIVAFPMQHRIFGEGKACGSGSKHRYFSTSIDALTSYTALSEVVFPTSFNHVQRSTLAWALFLKERYNAELVIKGSVLLESSSRKPSDIDMVFFVPVSGAVDDCRESMLRSVMGLTAMFFGVVIQSELNFRELFYMNILPHSRGFSLRTSKEFYEKKPYFNDQHLPLDIEFIFSNVPPRNEMMSSWTLDSLTTSYRLVFPAYDLSQPTGKPANHSPKMAPLRHIPPAQFSIRSHSADMLRYMRNCTFGPFGNIKNLAEFDYRNSSEILSLELPLSHVQALLARKLIVMGPFENTLDVFRLIKFHQREYHVVELNVEKKCIANTAVILTNSHEQEPFFSRAHRVLTSIIKKKDSRSLDSFFRMFSLLKRHPLDTFSSFSVDKLLTKASEHVVKWGGGKPGVQESFAQRSARLGNTIEQVSQLKTVDESLFKFVEACVNADLHETDIAPVTTDSIIQGVTTFLSASTVSEQREVDRLIIKWCSVSGNEVSSCIKRSILSPKMSPMALFNEEDISFLTLLKEHGSHSAASALLQHSRLYNRMKQVFEAITVEAAISKDTINGRDTVILQHTFKQLKYHTYDKRRLLNGRVERYRLRKPFNQWTTWMHDKRLAQASLVNTVESVYTNHTRAVLKRRFIQYKKQVLAQKEQDTKHAFMRRMGAISSCIESDKDLKTCITSYKEYMAQVLAVMSNPNDLEPFVVSQLPAISFLFDQLHDTNRRLFVSTMSIYELSQPTLDQLVQSIHLKKKLYTLNSTHYWARESTKEVNKRVSFLYNCLSNNPDVVGTFSRLFYTLDQRYQEGYRDVFIKDRRTEPGQDMMKQLFLENPPAFMALHHLTLDHPIMYSIVSLLKRTELESSCWALFKAPVQSNSAISKSMRQMELALIKRLSTVCTTSRLLTMFKEPLLTLVKHDDCKDNECVVELKKEIEVQERNRILTGIRFCAFLLMGVSFYVNETNSELRSLARGGMVVAFVYLCRSFT